MDDKELQIEQLPEEDLQELDLDAIIQEFSHTEEKPTEPEAVTGDTIPLDLPLLHTEQVCTDDTIRLDLPAQSSPAVSTDDDTIRLDLPLSEEPAVSQDTIRLDRSQLPKGTVRNAQPVDEEEELPPPAEEAVTEETFSEAWEPEYEQPMGEYVPPQPIVFQPRSRIRELKRKLVAGPEKEYYTLLEKGLGKLQALIFLSFLVVLISAGATVMYALGMVQENRMRLMVFGQFFAMLISALLGSYRLIEGVTDLVKGKFTLNTLLVFSFIACCADGVLCLQQLRVPCCAAFSLQMLMSLWSAYQRRTSKMGQMDTLRRANRLDSLQLCSDYHEGRKGFLRGEGQPEDFMDHYEQMPKPERVLHVYSLVALGVSVAIAVTAGVLHGIYQGVQVLAVSLLAAVPASTFVTVSRPFGVLERRLHRIGVVLCGWQGVQGLSGKALFPFSFEDLFPAGTVRMNGVKFFGSRPTDQVVAYGTAVIVADGGGLSELFTQVLDSRNGRHYDAYNLRSYENGGIGAEVEGEAVLVGSLGFLKSMGVEVPEGIRISQAVCVAIDGELCGLFAVTYDRLKASAAGLGTLCSYRGLRPVLHTGDFVLTGGFIRSKFGIKPRKILFPDFDTRQELLQKQPDEGPALLLSTSDSLAPFAYGVAGARALRTATVWGVVIHMIGGIAGLVMMLILAILGSMEYLTPVNMFLYHLIWMLPGLLITEWTRAI